MSRHVIAFTTAVAETMKAKGHAEASRWLHYGLTSNDVVDTAQALQLKQASAILLDGLRGSEAADVGALAHAVSRLSVLAADLGDAIDALDVNPVIVSAKGCVAVDALVIARPT
jgi:adenylosuccinate lyase